MPHDEKENGFDTGAAIRRLEKLGLLPPLEAAKVKKKAKKKRKKKKKEMGNAILKIPSKKKAYTSGNAAARRQLRELDKEGY